MMNANLDADKRARFLRVRLSRVIHADEFGKDERTCSLCGSILANRGLPMRLLFAFLLLFASSSRLFAGDWTIEKGVQAFIDVPFIAAIAPAEGSDSVLGLKCYQHSGKLGLGGFEETILLTGVDGDQAKDGDTQDFALRSDNGKTVKALLKFNALGFAYADGKKQADFVASTIVAIQESSDHFGTLYEGSTHLFNPKNTADTFDKMRAFCAREAEQPVKSGPASP